MIWSHLKIKCNAFVSYLLVKIAVEDFFVLQLQIWIWIIEMICACVNFRVYSLNASIFLSIYFDLSSFVNDFIHTVRAQLYSHISAISILHGIDFASTNSNQRAWPKIQDDNFYDSVCRLLGTGTVSHKRQDSIQIIGQKSQVLTIEWSKLH